MSLYSDNIKYLRIKKNVSQQVVANVVRIPRSRYAKYEDGVNFPPPEILLALSRYYLVSIDILLSIDVRKIPIADLLKLENNRFLMPVQVDSDGENKIEVVSEKAKAGYLPGSVNQEYVEELQSMSFPGLRNGKYRTFPIGGDSMSFSDKSFITAKLIESFSAIKDGKTYIVVTHSEGMAYKRLYKKGKDSVIAESDNPLYEPYEIKAEDLWEVWEFAYAHDPNDAKKEIFDNQQTNMILLGLSRDIQDVKAHIGIE